MSVADLVEIGRELACSSIVSIARMSPAASSEIVVSSVASGNTASAERQIAAAERIHDACRQIRRAQLGDERLAPRRPTPSCTGRRSATCSLQCASIALRRERCRDRVVAAARGDAEHRPSPAWRSRYRWLAPSSAWAAAVRHRRTANNRDPHRTSCIACPDVWPDTVVPNSGGGPSPHSVARK